MNRPLPSSLQPSSDKHDEPNAGLWYDKFFDQWNEAYSAVREGGKASWVKSGADKPVGTKHAVEEMARRIGTLAENHGGQLAYFRTDGPFVTGLGRSHPVENGFAWHHTLGTPYLPGSSLKGMLRAWAHEKEIKPTDIARIFGAGGSRSGTVGSVVFFDAIPTKPVSLAADVMTPHYSPWYQDEMDQIPPADWHDPTPIPFLVVATGQSFVFALAPRRPQNSDDQKDCETVFQWLAQALDSLGAGAKTSVGYGRFVLDLEATQSERESAALARREREQNARLNERLRGLGPVAQELERQIEAHNLEAKKDAFSNPPWIEQWLDKLEEIADSHAIERLTLLVRKHFPGLLEEPGRVRGKKQEPIFRERQRSISKRLSALIDRVSRDA